MVQRHALQTWYHLTVLQQAGIAVASIILLVLGILATVYRHGIFEWLGGVAQSWRDLPGGWAILWALTFVVSFPPMIGYSTLVTIAGFVFGMRGWFIMASATIIGSTCSLVVSRTLLKDFVGKMTAKNKQFAALSLVLKHDGLKLLCLIRLCPLPYSLANGAISTIPTVTWPNFMLATAIASPKLLLHIFVGWKIGELAEHGDKMDTKTQIISYLSILVGVCLGAGTGYLIYMRTKARAKQLEAEEVAAAGGLAQDVSDEDAQYADSPALRVPINTLRGEDDISLHSQALDHNGHVYRDEFMDDEDAVEQDVFDIGNDEDDDLENGDGKPGK
jgi:uncharacterized membrane protein YdjX (TVP38/TMEM64 family)